MRVFTDGSLISNWKDAGADVHYKYFSQYSVFDKNSNHYDGELEATKVALELSIPYITQKKNNNTYIFQANNRKYYILQTENYK